ncbi:hypothetical protein [Nonomuraea sp. GTA35]|uniref:hypothetical protein n=1 Tax=Nonomuraea sp. GTA35 TaxID=1676746 RepID=UPI0035C216D2
MSQAVHAGDQLTVKRISRHDGVHGDNQACPAAAPTSVKAVPHCRCGMNTPAAEADIDDDLVDRLIRAQHPDLAGPLTAVANGWDNVIHRLGADLSVRLPRRRVAVDLIVNEQRWLPVLAGLRRGRTARTRQDRRARRGLPVAVDDRALDRRPHGRRRAAA